MNFLSFYPIKIQDGILITVPQLKAMWRPPYYKHGRRPPLTMAAIQTAANGAPTECQYDLINGYFDKNVLNMGK